GYPEPGLTTAYDGSDLISPDTVPLNGGFLLRTLGLSINPSMRGRMRPSGPGYDAIWSHEIGVVLRSELAGVNIGDNVYGAQMSYLDNHREYNVFKELAPFTFLKNQYNLPWSTFVGVAGMPGKTAYFGWKEYSKARGGETIFVTTGGGPIGSLVIQLAKADGLKVIASARSDEKVSFMKALGADVEFNYKTTDTKVVLEREGPIDIYWDNVGGSILDLALSNSNVGARFIECGMILGYNATPTPIQARKSITIQGLLVHHLQAKYDEEFYNVVPEKLANGELKYKEHIWDGLESVGEAILAVQKGLNTAKAIIRVSE
ncbi:alcohol dehydrogenase, partial [Coprinopsis marcescibilis]